MSDPFRQYMDTWVPSVGLHEAFTSWLQKSALNTCAYVQPDFQPFMDTSGKLISGRRDWKEHLASTGTQELGRGDLKAATDRHVAAKQAKREQWAKASAQAPVRDTGEARPVVPSETVKRVLNRLEGRPAPSRTELVRIAMEERLRGR